MPVIFVKEFFDLQLQVAERVRAISGRSLESALLHHTNLYVRLGCGRDFDENCRDWREYLDGLRSGGDIRDWTYRFYLRDPERNTAPAAVARFGCFSYSQVQGGVRLHFRGTSRGEPAPLGVASATRRRAELSELFSHARDRVPLDARVRGRSWLYSLKAYRRLFPDSYAASTKLLKHPSFRSMHLWGQFVDGRGQLRRRAARQFFEALQNVATIDNMASCLPLRPRHAEAPLIDFLRYYQVRWEDPG